MDDITVYLKTPLFTFRGANTHLPREAACVEGQLESRGGGGLTIKATSFKDERGRDLESTPATLFIPMQKIDHAILASE